MYTFRTILDPASRSPQRGAFRDLQSVDARDPYTVVFTLSEPFASFPINLVIPQIVPAGAGSRCRGAPDRHRTRTGSSATPSTIASSWQPSTDYCGGRPANDGLVLRIVPDEVMRGLELRKGTVDIVVNDVSPDIVYQLAATTAAADRRPRRASTISTSASTCAIRRSSDVRVRQALAHAIDRQAIVDHLRRGLATPADGLLPPIVVGATTRHRRRMPTTRNARGRCSTRPAIRIRTATVRRRGCGSP